MKIVNEKGKLFGLINVVDLMVLILVVGAVAGVAWSIFGGAVRDSVAPTVTMTATFRIRGANSFLVDELERNDQVGKYMVSGNDYTDAIITDVEIVDYRVQVTTADGQIVDALDPVKKDVLVTATCEVPKNTPTPTIGSQEVRAGRAFTVKTNDFEVAGTVESVTFDD